MGSLDSLSSSLGHRKYFDTVLARIEKKTAAVISRAPDFPAGAGAPASSPLIRLQDRN